MVVSTEDKQFEQVVQGLDPRNRLLRTWQLAGGASAHMTVLEIVQPDGQTRKMIVRRPSKATLQRNPQAAADEFKLLRITQSYGLPTQIAYSLDTSGQIFPTPYLVIEYIEGQPEFTAANPGDFILQFAAQLARIHRVVGATPELAFLPEQTIGIPAVTLTQSDDERRIGEILTSFGNLPQLNESVLLHGDFWPGNLLWKDGKLVAVIDWEDAARGDSLADFAISRLDTLLIFGLNIMESLTDHYQSITVLDCVRLRISRNGPLATRSLGDRTLLRTRCVKASAGS
jgi:aminoglycoside phosphotransferase (APT) family kinase protein